jgi:hypothetical protein
MQQPTVRHPPGQHTEHPRGAGVAGHAFGRLEVVEPVLRGVRRLVPGREDWPEPAEELHPLLGGGAGVPERARGGGLGLDYGIQRHPGRVRNARSAADRPAGPIPA